MIRVLMPDLAKMFFSRVVQGILALLTISLLIFLLLHQVGGDALMAMHGESSISEEAIAGLRHIYGLDRSVMERYLDWLYEAVQGQFGYSFYYQVPVANIIWRRLLNTAALAGVALVIAWSFAVTLGIVAARRAGTWIDHVCNLIVLIGSSTPHLVLALGVLTFAAHTIGMTVGGPTQGLSASSWFLRLLPPALVLCVPLVALFLSQTRASVGMALNQEFVRVARAKGLPEKIILFRHVLRPALTPLITIFGYALGGLMSGSVIVEKVMGWPGLGELSVIAVLSRDVPLLMGVALVTATMVLAFNLLADILFRLNDPRQR